MERLENVFHMLTDFICHYEERVIITGVKRNQHCTICWIPPKERQNLTRQWPFRTHEWTQGQIELQRQRHVPRKSADWVHDIECFAWSHHLINIHETMMIDVLHQPFKGMIMHLLSWIQDLLKQEMSASRKRKNREIKTRDLSGLSIKLL